MNKEELEGYVKTSINNCFKKMAEEPEEFFDNYKLQEKYNKVLKENYNLKQALNKIKEYIKNLRNFHIEYELKNKKHMMYASEENFITDILQIIDKYMKEDD